LLNSASANPPVSSAVPIIGTTVPFFVTEVKPSVLTPIVGVAGVLPPEVSVK
jgi:hypothetical protein